MTLKIGKAVIWYCDITERGCGFFGFYKPESPVTRRKCPACGLFSPYRMIEGELAEFSITEAPTVSQEGGHE